MMMNDVLDNGLLSQKPTDDVLRCTKEIVIKNRNGLHARPAAMFVKISSRFEPKSGWKKMVNR